MSSRVKMMLMLIGAATLAVALAWIFTTLKGEVPNATSSEIGPKVVPSESKAQAPWPVQVLKPQRRDIAYTISLPANISPWQQASLYAKVPGYLKWMGFDKGAVVKQGQLLAVIDAPEIAQQYHQAESDYKIKQLTYQRMFNVWKDNPDVIAKQDVDVAEAGAEAAKHAMERYRVLQDYMKVTAPFSGVITARFADPGAMIQAATGSATQTAPLYTLMNLDTVRVYANVPQEVARLAKPGVSSVLTAREIPGKSFQGSITRTTEALDPATRTLLIEIDMPNAERHLQPGMFVNATLSLRQHPNALVIPPAAIVNSGSDKGKSVFVIEEGKARRVPIKTDIDDGVWVEVTEGLNDQHNIVVVGKTGLSEGQVVKVSEYNLPAGKPSSQRY